jgi:hypothetical protein
MGMKREAVKDKRYSETTGKLHIPCPFKERTGIKIHVVIKGRYCYRSDECMVLECKYNKSRTKIENILSMTW